MQVEEDNLMNLLCSNVEINRTLALSIAHGSPETYPNFWESLLRVWRFGSRDSRVTIPKHLDKALEYHEKFVGSKKMLNITDSELDIKRLDIFYNVVNFSFITEKIVTMPITRLFSSVLIKYQEKLNEDSLSNIYFSDYPSSMVTLGLVGSNVHKSEIIINIIQKWCNLISKPELTIYIGRTPLVNNISELCNLKDFITSKPDAKKHIGIYNSFSRNLLDLPIEDFTS